jgi:hypothetical protein
VLWRIQKEKYQKVEETKEEHTSKLLLLRLVHVQTVVN